MSTSPRLLGLVAIAAVLTAAGVVHLLPRHSPLAGPPLFAPATPTAEAAPLRLPSLHPPGPAGGALPPVLADPQGFWRLLNRDTAATTRGQLSLVRSLADTLRDQLRGLLEHPPLAGPPPG